MTFAEAQAYCGNSGEAYERVGEAQLAILKAAGCLPHHHVLEIGCGALCGGRKFIEYLDPNAYLGIERNLDLVDAAMAEYPHLRDRIPYFSINAEFDAGDTLAPREFDFVFGHSVLSHAAHWQLPQMLTALRPVLADGAQVIMSIRLREESSYDREWQYPGNSWFAWESVCRFATACGFEVVLHEDWQEIMMAAAANNCHDWIAFRKVDA